MGAVYVDAAVGDDLRRERLYAGDLFAYSPGPDSAGLCGLAREMAEEVFAPHDPPVAQDSMTAEEYAQILADLKPRFIHHPRAKELIPGMLAHLGCDLERTYFDVPRLRTMAHGEFMKVGLALQFHPHRDTWFSAPYAQLNWWLPVYEIESDNSMAFHPRYSTLPSRTARRSTTTRSGRALAGSKPLSRSSRRHGSSRRRWKSSSSTRRFVWSLRSEESSFSRPLNPIQPCRTQPTAHGSASTSAP